MPHKSAAERVARESYGRLVAVLASRSGDIAAAEDALGEAFRAALEQWPDTGAPESPEAWLLTVARRRIADGVRKGRVRDAAAGDLVLAAADPESEPSSSPDPRLAMLFVCAHEAIDQATRTPLMLQVVLGMDAQAISAAFLVSPRAMSQRLVRAKRKLRDAHIRFAVPDRAEWPGRLGSVLDAIYAAYGAGWNGAGTAGSELGLAEEAIWLASIVCRLLPDEPEAHGLLSLMLHCEARRPARYCRDGTLVPLSEQDPSLWSTDLMARAEQALRRAFKAGIPGRYQLEASIQSAHAERAWTGATPWQAIVEMYDVLVQISPTVGALVSRAAAIGQAQGAEAGLQALRRIPEDRAGDYQPFWAVKAHLLAHAGRSDEAVAAYRLAIGLTEEARLRAWLAEKLAGLQARLRGCTSV